MSESKPGSREGSSAAALVTRVADELEHRLARTLDPGLYLVATPIGNLADITLRALCVMSQATHLYCEDTRQSLKLLQRFGISRRLETYHEHNAEATRPRILAALQAGASVAIISDAGTPLVSDPGYKLVRAAVEAAVPVHALPGPSAVLAGLTGSGLPTDAFYFAGFMPQRSAQRRSRIEALAAVPGTLVLFEAPGRCQACLEDLALVLGPRPAAVARELTKLNETYHRGTLDELASWSAATEIRGEVVIVVGEGQARVVDDEAVRAALTAALAVSSVRDAAGSVALQLGIPRRRVYELALSMIRTMNE